MKKENKINQNEKSFSYNQAKERKNQRIRQRLHDNRKKRIQESQKSRCKNREKLTTRENSSSLDIGFFMQPFMML